MVGVYCQIILSGLYNSSGFVNRWKESGWEVHSALMRGKKGAAVLRPYKGNGGIGLAV
jgi:hypothetical protein